MLVFYSIVLKNARFKFLFVRYISKKRKVNTVYGVSVSAVALAKLYGPFDLV